MADKDALIAEQIRHTLDLLRADLNELRREQGHLEALIDQRLGVLEAASLDHEARIRELRDGVTSFKVWSGLASGGSSLIALLALLRALLSG